MERENVISDELRLLSPVVGNISRKTPYEAPGGYFDAFPGRVMGLVGRCADGSGADGAGADGSGAAGRIADVGGAGRSVEGADDSGSGYAGSEMGEDSALFPQQAGRVPLYTVPAGYFDEFAGKLMARIKAQASLSESQTPLNEFQTPMSELERISPLLSRMNKTTPFEAPEGYFSELLTNVVSGVKAIEFVNDELDHQFDGFSALGMPGLKEKSVYQVPEGYFENLAGDILARVAQPATVLSDGSAQAKVVSLHRRRNWWQYSAAAAMAGLVLTIGWLSIFNKHTPTGSNNDILNLSKVSDQEIQNYLDNHNVPLAESVPNSTVTLDISDSDIKSMLGDVSDDELKQYLDEHVGSRDLATN